MHHVIHVTPSRAPRASSEISFCLHRSFADLCSGMWETCRPQPLAAQPPLAPGNISYNHPILDCFGEKWVSNRPLGPSVELRGTMCCHASLLAFPVVPCHADPTPQGVACASCWAALPAYANLRVSNAVGMSNRKRARDYVRMRDIAVSAWGGVHVRTLTHHSKAGHQYCLFSRPAIDPHQRRRLPRPAN